MLKNMMVKFNFGNLPIDCHKKCPFTDTDTFIYMGEIFQMPEYCIVARMSDGRIFSGEYLTSDFIEASKEDLIKKKN